MRTTRYLLLALGLIAAQVNAAELSEADRRQLSLALDLCGDVVAREPGYLDRAVRSFSGLTLVEARPLAQVIDDRQVRASLHRLLGLEDDTPVQIAAFGPQPSANAPPYALLSVKDDFCLVIDTPGRSQNPGLRPRLTAPGTRWRHQRDDPDGTSFWERDVGQGGGVSLVASWDHEMIIVARPQAPIATAAQISGITQTVLDACVAGILAEQAPSPSFLLPAFEVKDRKFNEHDSAIVTTMLESQVPGPRTLVAYSTYQDSLHCEFQTSDLRQPTRDVLATVVATIARVADAREIKAGKRGKEPELHAWRIKRHGASRYVDISVTVREEKFVTMTIEQTRGLFR